MQYKNFRDKFCAENKARRAVEKLFFEYNSKTPKENHLSLVERVVFEGVEPHQWPTKTFKSHFNTCVEMEQYFYHKLAPFLTSKSA